MIIFACRVMEQWMDTAQEPVQISRSQNDSGAPRRGEFVNGLQNLVTVTRHRSSYVGNDAGWATATPAPARVKVLNPLTSTGPSMHAEILGVSETGLVARVPRSILIGSTVRVRMGENVAFGEVRSCSPRGSEFEIAMEVQRSS